MNQTKVLYKGKEYVVYNPGKVINYPKFIDQLDENLIEVNIRWRDRYISRKYNLTPEDYYIIVALLGDTSLIPKCKCRRCNNNPPFCSTKMRYKEFCCRSCTATETNLLGMETGSNKWIITNRGENWINPFKGENGSKLSSSVSKRLINEGRHPWQGEKGSMMQKERLENGTHPFLKQETRIKGARKLFETKGDPNDICCIYLARENKNLEVIKLGVTIDINKRSHHFGNYYSEFIILASDNRMKIAWLEYEVKMKYSSLSVKGDEYFDIKMMDEIINYVKSLYNN